MSAAAAVLILGVVLIVLALVWFLVSTMSGICVYVARNLRNSRTSMSPAEISIRPPPTGP